MLLALVLFQFLFIDYILNLLTSYEQIILNGAKGTPLQMCFLLVPKCIIAEIYVWNMFLLNIDWATDFLWK